MLTIPQTAIEFSLCTFFKVLALKRPEKLFDSICNNEDGTIREVTNGELEKMTKLCRKTWRVRVLRYASLLPQELFDMDPFKSHFKLNLKNWVLRNIPKDGDYIFQGKTKPPVSNDWLTLELEHWKDREAHDVLGLVEVEDILE